ncbi:hypothetical protein MNB_SV-9-1638 [hydrothermal vent metagenome]|uniref:RloB domain-containing protein n=1 Tax=hydrothermal vent metagenome TaxID=652676 RepID=A0A1W1C1S6_9ZZZZ
MARRGGDKIHNRKKELKKSDFKRQINNKKTVPDILIACEDTDSSPTYFRMIMRSLINRKIITQDSLVIAKHKHTNPKGVLQDLKEHNKDGKKYQDFEHKWIVIDRDKARVNGGGHSKEDFNVALDSAKSSKSNFNIKVAYANDAFELWYLLHFEYRNTALSRENILEELIKKLKTLNSNKFAKLNSKNIKSKEYSQRIFKILLDKQTIAIKNAKKLLASYGDTHNPQLDNPSTTIHLLVDILNNIDKEVKL